MITASQSTAIRLDELKKLELENAPSILVKKHIKVNDLIVTELPKNNVASVSEA